MSSFIEKFYIKDDIRVFALELLIKYIKKTRNLESLLGFLFKFGINSDNVNDYVANLTSFLVEIETKNNKIFS